MRVYHNTVFSENYFNSIEYRFKGTQNAHIANNVVSKKIRSRDGGSAVVDHNVLGAAESWFVNLAAGDLRLRTGLPNVVDQGISLDEVLTDIECEARPQGEAPDVGADEVRGGVTYGVEYEQQGAFASILEEVRLLWKIGWVRLGEKFFGQLSVRKVLLVGGGFLGAYLIGFTNAWYLLRKR